VSEQHTINAPIPGVFYRRPDPESPPFVQEGEQVEAGAVVGLIEVMKQFHELHADSAGTVVEFLVENEDVVDVGQPVVALG
jgi:acetyl-CoA carboxylase biotin carboxyl carrier protein